MVFSSVLHSLSLSLSRWNGARVRVNFCPSHQLSWNRDRTDTHNFSQNIIWCKFIKNEKKLFSRNVWEIWVKCSFVIEVYGREWRFRESWNVDKLFWSHFVKQSSTKNKNWLWFWRKKYRLNLKKLWIQVALKMHLLRFTRLNSSWWWIE